MNEILYQALCACLGLSPSSAEASALIREAYQEPENAPRPPRNTDVIYYSLTPDESAPVIPPCYDPATSIIATPHSGARSFRLTSAPTNPPPLAVVGASPWKLLLVCYGPHAADNARRIRTFLYLDGAGFPRSILRKAGLYPVPSPPEPLILHEPEGSLWRLRADLTVSLYTAETQTHPARRNAVTAAPAVILHHE